MAKKAAGRKADRAAPSGSGRARRSDRAGRSDEVSDYKQKQRAAKQAGAKKSGCAPKLFVLMLPFLAVATYLFTRT